MNQDEPKHHSFC